jgi:hypothetical protein
MSALPSTIRASSIAAMLGLDPRKSPLALFHELCGTTGFDDADEQDGDDEDAPIDDPILEGRLFEDAVANVVRRKFKLMVEDPDDSKELRDRHIVGHRDRIFTEDGRHGVLEIKNPFTPVADGYGDPGSDVVPRRHWCQTQTYQGLFRRFMASLPAPAGDPLLVADHSYLAARLRGGVELFKVGYDDEVYEAFQKEAERFLHRVHMGDPPTPRDEQDMRRRWMVDDTRTVIVGADVLAWMKQLKEVKAGLKAGKQAESELKTLIFGRVADAKFVSYRDGDEGPITSIATVGSDRRFDVAAFTVAHPDLAQRCQKLDKAAVKALDERLYDSFMRKPANIAEQKRVLRLQKTLDALQIPAAPSAT